MSIEIKAPVFPESVVEGGIAAWHVKVGDAVKAGQVLVEIETDKVVLEVQATGEGIIQNITKNVGDSVRSEEVIGLIGASGAAAMPAASAQKTAPSALAPVTSPSVAASAEDPSPAVRRAIGENNLSPDQVSKIKGTGKDGRLTPEDIKNFIAHGSSVPLAPSVASAPASVSSVTSQAGRMEERVPMSRLRKTIAKRLLDVQQSSALLTTFNEVDMYAVQQLRAKYKDQFEKTHGVKLGLMSFFVKATVAALKKFPNVNASIDGDDVVYHGYFDVSVAVSSERGLVVPVVRNADQKSMAEIEKEIRDFAVRASSGKLSIEEMQGGTFTITNGGTFGSMLSTPIINPPQSAILGMHNIVDRAVVVAGEVKVRPVMYLALTYDHRIIDGRDSVLFLKAIKDALEDPARLIFNL
jgi:2-oxoglutarate dehydrogenase E2 component (dihydrolipoamide succinyltransferase)